MVNFYNNWLEKKEPLPKGQKEKAKVASSGGMSKREAFLKAQRQIKAKYPKPYYWGAFVMVGE
jgi:hypothetical protein